MTAGQDGTPENDDPFGYLYRAEDGSEQPAAPRTSYNQVQRVGERRSPQQPQGQQQGGYGYPPAQQPGQPQGGYGYPQPQQQAYGYDQQQGGQQYTRQQPQYAPAPQPGDGGGHRGAGPGHGGGDAPNRKGLLIAAIAVVAAVAIGIAIAMSQGDGKGNEADNKPSSPPVSSAAPTAESQTPSASPTPFASDKVDANTFALTAPAATSTQWPGSNAGTYVDNMNQVGAAATWTVTVPEDGAYTFFISYGNAGPDATLSLAVNGKMRTTPVKLRNYGSYTDWSKAWNNTTYAYVNLTKGENTLALSFQDGDTGGVNLDQTWLKQGQVTK
ncbi:carbohydrate-binding protein [Actinacidiphila bryophytorum]|uniref:Carbohydrate binding module (Family 6) n=1 Tax=Actinacidiphila bryophytorum TaxID=1436133 RepID=A0A9W4H0Z8_9ACTN|nr:carbohydrate-binding protein [Actinacidiphila bryophytorum]MBM9439987.1 carbohydrate-binding protein [Actinacidiphila bryophytorum]MBN6547979.1 carbohydrate-binding protein [Actinacidiphila bryophytorum]CAG7640055.1 Carbohydrate binding module (Family 6) [Actinacidiphila bryophytorum]